MPTTKLIIISGRSGSGKTSVANELHHQLSAKNIPHASIEGDSLDMLYPEEDGPEVFLANLISCWQNIITLRGCSILVLNGTAVILDRETIRQALESVAPAAAVEMKSFILECSEETARARLVERERGSTLEEHLHRSSRMAKVLADVEDASIKHVSVDGMSISETTGQILERSLDWLETSS